jgi:hypothetical protein
MGNRVAVYKLQDAVYPPADDLYAPSEAFPEYPFPDNVSEKENEVYHAVRESLALLGMDEARFGTSEWNPLADRIRPGDTVVLKPNMVLNYSLDGRNDMETRRTARGSEVRDQ